MGLIASNIESILGLVCLTGLCAPGIAFGFGAIVAQGARGLIRLASPKKAKMAVRMPTMPWLIAQSVLAGVATAAVARVIASISDMPFSPWGYVATPAGLLTLVFTILFTGAGVDDIKAETPRDTNRNLYASLGGLTAGAVLASVILALTAG